MARHWKSRKKRKKVERSVKTTYRNIVAGSTKCLKLEVSTRYNARWGHDDILNMLSRICETSGHGSATDQYDTTLYDGTAPLPSSHWFFDRFNSISPEDMLERCTVMIDRTVRRARAMGMLRGTVEASIDFHESPMYGKVHKSGRGLDSTYCVNTKRTRGTNKCYRLATIHCVTPRCRLVLGVILVQATDSVETIVSRLLNMVEKRKIRVGRVTLDRGFNSKEVIRELERRGMNYIMPYIKYETIKKIIMEVEDGKRDAVSSHTISKNTDPETVTVVVLKHDKKTIEDKKNMTEGEKRLDDTFKEAVKSDRTKRKNKKEHDPVDDYYVFITNLPLSDIQKDPQMVAKLYKERWGIETAYRCYERIRPRTTTTKHTPRIVLLFFPWVLYNAWIVANHLSWRNGDGTRGKPFIKQSTFMTAILSILNMSVTVEHKQLDSKQKMFDTLDAG